MSGDFLPKHGERHSEERSVCVLRCDSSSEGCWGADLGPALLDFLVQRRRRVSPIGSARQR